jgi:hypothetical protein
MLHHGGQLAVNTGGYLLVTGDVSSEVQRFTQVKFFIQVLKNATFKQTVVDPASALSWNGAKQVVPFPVCAAPTRSRRGSMPKSCSDLPDTHAGLKGPRSRPAPRLAGTAD